MIKKDILFLEFLSKYISSPRVQLMLLDKILADVLLDSFPNLTTLAKKKQYFLKTLLKFIIRLGW